VAFFIYAKLLLAELRLHCAAAQKHPFSAAQYFNPGALGLQDFDESSVSLVQVVSRVCVRFSFALCDQTTSATPRRFSSTLCCRGKA
jgi:hypothetical protein